MVDKIFTFVVVVMMAYSFLWALAFYLGIVVAVIWAIFN